MLDLETRGAILRLALQGHGSRFIAHAVGVSRDSVKKVIRSGQAEVPKIERPDQLEAHLEKVRQLFLDCRGNLVRVHEELRARHEIHVPYSTLTRFCRDADIGKAPKVPAGRYVFKPGEEMQHDTSPHRVVVGECSIPLQCASLVMCYSRRKFFQCYRRWTRFHVKVFLTRAIVFFGGSAATCMLDNSTVIMTGGTGPDARAVPEMQAFSDRFGFKFVSHQIGDANRSARVEAPFWYIENNFYSGRTFKDLADLNAQAEAWCRDYNRKFHKSFGGVPDEMGVVERLSMHPLPPYIPEPTDVHVRRVDPEGYVTLHTNRYSVPETLIGRPLEIHETIDHVRVFEGHRLVAEHQRREDGMGARVTLTDHHGRCRRMSQPRPPTPEETALRTAGPALAALCDALHKDRYKGSRAIRRLHRMWLEYPTEVVEAAVARALEFRLTDLDRIERMVLRDLHGAFFRLPMENDDG